MYRNVCCSIFFMETRMTWMWNTGLKKTVKTPEPFCGRLSHYDGVVATVSL